jgi:membrane-associated PAP2 superfamily phosphatase
MYFYARKPALYLFPGLFVGFVFAFGQQARGAHFLSHDLWSISLCWFGALGLFLLFRPGTWPRPEPVSPDGGGPVR